MRRAQMLLLMFHRMRLLLLLQMVMRHVRLRHHSSCLTDGSQSLSLSPSCEAPVRCRAAQSGQLRIRLPSALFTRIAHIAGRRPGEEEGEEQRANANSAACSNDCSGTLSDSAPGRNRSCLLQEAVKQLQLIHIDSEQ